MRVLARPAVGIGVACAIALTSLSPAAASPVMTSAALLKSAAPSDVVDVRWRGRRGGAVATGVAAGLIVGGIAAAAASPRYYAPRAHYYGGPVYYEPAPVYIEPAPVYAAPPAYYGPAHDPNGPVRRCWVTTDERGFGYWQPC